MNPLTWNPIRPLLKPMEDRPGCASGFTVTVKLCVALKLGDPLSATFKVKAFVVPACVTSEGITVRPALFHKCFFVNCHFGRKPPGSFGCPAATGILIDQLSVSLMVDKPCGRTPCRWPDSARQSHC